MTDAAKYQFTNLSGPKAYDEFFVPRLFQPWAKLLLDEVNLQPGEAVLDVATGPGTVARLAAVRLGSQGRVVATDIALPMLDIARAKPEVTGAARVEYVESPAAPLAAPSGTFDAVLCQQGIQFFPDRPAALREMHRVLKPNGRAAIAVWAELERNQIAAAFHAALSATAPAELASVMMAPYGWPSASALKDAAEEAGFREIRLLILRLPMVLEGGLDQAIRLFSATPVWPSVAALPQDVQEAFFARLRRELAPLESDGKVIGETTSNIIIANC
jgi:ubiquinone/menaquinone biosynthesis C-methylase UbiE